MRYLTVLSRGLFAVSAFICLPGIVALIGTGTIYAAALVGLDVVRRYFFNAPLIWAQEGATLVLFLAIVLALPESWQRGVHIKADFLTAIMGNAFNEVLARAVWILVLIVSVLIAIQCRYDIELMILFNERSTDLNLPLSWFRAILGSIVMFCALLALAKAFSRKPACHLDGDPK